MAHSIALFPPVSGAELLGTFSPSWAMVEDAFLNVVPAKAEPISTDATTWRASAIPRRSLARVLRYWSLPPVKEGAGNAGCTMHPQPRVQLINKARKRIHHRFTGITRHFLHNGFNGYSVLSLVYRAC